VNAIKIRNGEIFVAGQFSRAGRVPANNVARFKGNVWSALGSGITGGAFPEVNALAVRGADVYVGGDFTSAGNYPSFNFAHWNDQGRVGFEPQLNYEQSNSRIELQWLPGFKAFIEFRPDLNSPWEAWNAQSLADDETSLPIAPEQESGFFRIRVED
jgi:hypothetical protein